MKVYIAGHSGMVGSAIWRNLEQVGNHKLIGRTSKQLDLKNQQAVLDFLTSEQPDAIIDAAARVGGILANNDYPYQFLMENMLIQNNLIHSAVELGIQKFIFLGSSCIYPKLAPQPLKEEYLLTDELESTNEWYAIAKISGVKATEAVRKQFGFDYVSLLPTNLYGTHDNFDLETSHVLPAMLRKFHEAKINGNSDVKLWGSGKPMREFLHVDDLAEAVNLALEQELPENLYNVGCGEDVSIQNLAMLIQEITGHKGKIVWDDSKPNGTPRKWIDSSKLLSRGWQPSIDLEMGIRRTYAWFLDHQNSYTKRKIS